MFGFFKKGNSDAPKEDADPPQRQIKPIFELQEEFLVKLLSAMYTGSERMDADPERFKSTNLPPEWSTIQDLYRLIQGSGLTDYPLPPEADEATWEQFFFSTIFPLSWNIANHLGIKADEGYVMYGSHTNTPKMALDLDLAIGWMRHSESRLVQLVYWLLHGRSNGSLRAPFIVKNFHSIVEEYSNTVSFSVAGSVKRTKSNVIYVWKALGRDTIDGKHLCKIGITNVSGGEGRLLQVAKKNGFNAEVLVFNLVGEELAPLIEKELLKLGTKPNSELSLADGKTEFRYLSDAEASSIPGIIFAIQDQNR